MTSVLFRKAEDAIQAARHAYRKYREMRGKQELGVVRWYRLAASDAYAVANDACLEAGRDIDAAQCRVNAQQLANEPGDLMTLVEVAKAARREHS